MIKNITYEELYNRIINSAKYNDDYICNMSQLIMNTECDLHVPNGFTLKITENAFRQICTCIQAKEFIEYGLHLYNIKEYYKLSSLFNFHLNEYLKNNSDRELLIRGKLGKCRAVLSNKYTIIDDCEIMDAFNQIKNDNIKLVSANIDDHRTTIRLKFEDKMLNLDPKVNDIVNIGLIIMNSEVGLSSFMLMPYVYRLVCTNGMVTSTMEQGKKYKHVGEKDIFSLINNTIDFINDNYEIELENFSRLKSIQLEQPMIMEEIESISNKYRYPISFVDNVRQSYLEEKDNTAYGLVNSFTRAAQTYEHEKRLEIETHAGEIMDRYLQTY
jgi:hypothetical protein